MESPSRSLARRSVFTGWLPLDTTYFKKVSVYRSLLLIITNRNIIWCRRKEVSRYTSIEWKIMSKFQSWKSCWVRKVYCEVVCYQQAVDVFPRIGTYPITWCLCKITLKPNKIQGMRQWSREAHSLAVQYDIAVAVKSAEKTDIYTNRLATLDSCVQRRRGCDAGTHVHLCHGSVDERYNWKSALKDREIKMNSDQYEKKDKHEKGVSLWAWWLFWLCTAAL